MHMSAYIGIAWLCIYFLSFSSKYVPRGSVRISNIVSNSSLECTAFLTPSSQVVVVVLNTGDNDITFKLTDINSGAKQALKVDAVAHSINTYMYM